MSDRTACLETSPDILRPRLEIALAALLFSTGGAAVKLIDASGWQIAGWRSAVAAAVFLLVLPGARPPWGPKVMVVGLAYAATLTCFVLATKSTTAANATFLQSTAPLYVMLLSPRLLGERIRLIDAFIALLFVLGLASILQNAASRFASAPDPVFGNTLGVASGFFWALTLLGLRELGRHSEFGSAKAVACGNFCCFLLCLPVIIGSQASLDTSSGAGLVALGTLQVALPYVLLTRGVRHVPAFTTSLLVLIETAFNPLWAWLIHDETLSLSSLFGGLLIIAAGVSRSAIEWRRGTGT